MIDNSRMLSMVDDDGYWLASVLIIDTSKDIKRQGTVISWLSRLLHVHFIEAGRINADRFNEYIVSHGDFTGDQIAVYGPGDRYDAGVWVYFIALNEGEDMDIPQLIHDKLQHIYSECDYYYITDIDQVMGELTKLIQEQ